jgi:chromosome segregation ATPase
MKALLLVLVLAIGLCTFGYFDQQRRAAASQELTASRAQWGVAQEQLGKTETVLEQTKRELQDSTQKLTELEAAHKKELAELQAKLDESTKQPAPAASEDSSKKLTADLDELKTKLTAAEAALARSKTETATAKTQVAASQAEVQRLQRLSARPPLGSLQDAPKK